MDVEKIKEIFKNMFDSNYRKGNPAVPPHRHTGIDNLQIDASDILNLPGATPGGSNFSVQFNNNGSFGGDTIFTYDDVTNTLTIPNIKSSSDINNSFDLNLEATFGASLNATTSNIDADGNPLGATGNIFVGTDDIDSSDTGNVTIQSGTSGTTGNSGDLLIQTGNTDTSAGNHVGNITIKTGSGNTDGDINITTGSINNSSHGKVTITATKGFTFDGGSTNSVITVANGLLIATNDSNGTGNLRFKSISTGPTAGHGNFSFGKEGVSPDYGGGVGVIFLENCTTIPITNPVGGGILYVTGGALTYRGSGGTITTIGPA